jgi:hypothetical protein
VLDVEPDPDKLGDERIALHSIKGVTPPMDLAEAGTAA